MNSDTTIEFIGEKSCNYCFWNRKKQSISFYLTITRKGEEGKTKEKSLKKLPFVEKKKCLYIAKERICVLLLLFIIGSKKLYSLSIICIKHHFTTPLIFTFP